jgi:hypothetical protein
MALWKLIVRFGDNASFKKLTFHCGESQRSNNKDRECEGIGRRFAKEADTQLSWQNFAAAHWRLSSGIPNAIGVNQFPLGAMKALLTLWTHCFSHQTKTPNLLYWSANYWISSAAEGSLSVLHFLSPQIGKITENDCWWFASVRKWTSQLDNRAFVRLKEAHVWAPKAVQRDAPQWETVMWPQLFPLAFESCEIKLII